jgi:hypothetical protein
VALAYFKSRSEAVKHVVSLPLGQAPFWFISFLFFGDDPATRALATSAVICLSQMMYFALSALLLEWRERRWREFGPYRALLKSQVGRRDP